MLAWFIKQDEAWVIPFHREVRRSFIQRQDITPDQPDEVARTRLARDVGAGLRGTGGRGHFALTKVPIIDFPELDFVELR